MKDSRPARSASPVAAFAGDHLMVTGESRDELRERRRRRRLKSKPKPIDVVRKKQRREARFRLPNRPVDPYATVAKKDRPMTPAQRSELAALSRDPFLNFTFKPTLTRGEARELIPALRKLTKTRRREQQKQPTKPRAVKS
jgi:hypothetical protein